MISPTFFLYIIIMLSTTLLASRSQRKLHGNVEFRKGLLIFSFLIHWFFLAFTRTGVDHDQYVQIIEFDALVYLSNGEEVGFNGLCILLNYLTQNAELCIMIIKTITLLLFYTSFYLLRKSVSLGFAVGAFNVWMYLFSFCILAHSLAISIITISIVMIICQFKWYWPVLLSLLAFTIHASALILSVLIIGVLILNSTKVKLSSSKVLILLLFAIIILNNAVYIFQYAISDINAFKQYDTFDIKQGGGGLFNYFFYAILFVLFLLPIIRSSLPRFFQNTAVLLFLFCFTSAIMGYFIDSTRLNYYSFTFYGVIIPFYFYQVKTRIGEMAKTYNLTTQKFFWTLYLCFMGFSTVYSACDPNSTMMMANYSFYNPLS